MEHCIYILYSEKFNKIYIGYTSNLIERFKSHNELGSKGWTTRFRPWKVIYCEYTDQKLIALKKEKQLKGGQGRKWLHEKMKIEYKRFGFISA